jgi:hypothetical protein
MLVDSGILASLETSKYVPLVPFLCEAGEHLGLGDNLGDNFSCAHDTSRSFFRP